VDEAIRSSKADFLGRRGNDALKNSSCGVAVAGQILAVLRRLGRKCSGKERCNFVLIDKNFFLACFFFSCPLWCRTSPRQNSLPNSANFHRNIIRHIDALNSDKLKEKIHKIIARKIVS
jgi:hypothetical protein